MSVFFWGPSSMSDGIFLNQYSLMFVDLKHIAWSSFMFCPFQHHSRCENHWRRTCLLFWCRCCSGTFDSQTDSREWACCSYFHDQICLHNFSHLYPNEIVLIHKGIRALIQSLGSLDVSKWRQKDWPNSL